MEVELVHRSREAGESGVDAALRNLAEHTDRATARLTAKFLEYPTDHLRLPGGAWPLRPTVLLSITLVTALGAGLAPTAIKAFIRRRATGRRTHTS